MTMCMSMTTLEPTTTLVPISTRHDHGAAGSRFRRPAELSARDTRTHTVVESPIGPLILTACGSRLTGVYMSDHAHAPAGLALGRRTVDGFDQVTQQLEQYFAGDRTRFDVPQCAEGTGFQRAVWQLLSTIPYGRTWTYTQAAVALGRPDRLRAVASAIGRNPLPVLVPGHRVVGAGGALTGFAGGLGRKR